MRKPIVEASGTWWMVTRAFLNLRAVAAFLRKCLLLVNGATSGRRHKQSFEDSFPDL